MSDDERTEDWSTTLIAYANGTLDDAGRREVDDLLQSWTWLQRELDSIVAVRDAIHRDEPPAEIPAGVWARIDLDEAGGSSVLPPPSLGPASDTADLPAPETPPPPHTPSSPNVVPLRSRRRMVTYGLSAAAAVVLVVGGAVVVMRSGDDSGDGQQATPGPTEPTMDPMTGTPAQALTMVASAMGSMDTATFAIEGSMVGTWDGAVVGRKRDVQVKANIRGDGAVDISNGTGDAAASRLHIETDYYAGPQAARPPDEFADTIVIDGWRYHSTNDKPYRKTEAPALSDDEAGIFRQLLASPDVFATLPDLAADGVDDLGIDEIDGVHVRHLSLTQKPGTFIEKSDVSTLDVWIDGDGMVRRMRTVTTSPVDRGGTIVSTMSADLERYGDPVDITVPD